MKWGKRSPRPTPYSPGKCGDAERRPTPAPRRMLGRTDSAACGVINKRFENWRMPKWMHDWRKK